MKSVLKSIKFSARMNKPDSMFLKLVFYGSVIKIPDPNTLDKVPKP